MKQRFTLFIATIFLSVCFPLTALSYDVVVDGIYYNLVAQEKTAEVARGDNKYTGEVTIPETITVNGEEYNVVTIGENAFYYCSSLISVTIPNSVTSIGNEAFCDCSSFTYVTIPNSVTSIGERAFRNCSSLTSVTIPNSVTNIGDGAFSWCTSLSSITIPNSVTNIGKAAFSFCSSLTSVIIPNSVTSIGASVVAGCSSLTSISVAHDNNIYDSRDNCNAIIRTSDNALIAGCQSTIIPNSVTGIGKAAFSECRSLTSVMIPNSVTSIGYGAFNFCTSLTSVTIPNSVTNIGEWAFSDCTSLTSVTISNSVTSIGYFVFDNCTSLTSVTIPNSVASIGYGAFSFCTSLTSVTIPNSVTSIGERAFSSCVDLQNVYCYAETVPSTETDAFYDSNVESATLYVPASAVDAYKTTEPWSTFGTIVALDDDTGINSVSKRGIAIQTAAGIITISGLNDNEKVDFYTLNGTVLGAARATNGVATFSAQSGSVLIARIGNESVKIIVE